MHDPKIVEALARAICCPNNPSCRCNGTCKAFIPYAISALTALCTLRPDVAAVLAGEDVAVPRRNAITPAMEKAGDDAIMAAYGASDWEDAKDVAESMSCRAIYRAMLAASPYAAKEKPDAE